MNSFKNNSGIITVDFIFALVLVMAFGSILFALSLTLTVADLTQYVTFASARNYMAAHISPANQETQARLKYLELLGHPRLVKLFTNGWFQVDSEPIVGDLGAIIPEYQPSAGDPGTFWGAGTAFVARMLDINFPIYGSTNPDGDGSGSGFSTFIGSYLGREVTTIECLNFVSQRWRQIRTLSVPSGATPYSSAGSEKGYLVYDDNGC